MIVFHICERAAWEGAGDAYRAPSLETEGFVHCSTVDQVRAVADALYRGRQGLVLLAIDSEALRSDVRFEDGFPHVYGPIEHAAVVDVIDFPASDDGSFEFPWRAAALFRREPRTLAELRVRVMDVMDGFDRLWWVAGGWSLDLWLGEVSREHEDVDITILRRDVRALREHLRDWDLRVPNPEVAFDEVPFDADVDSGQHQIWARRRDGRTPAGRIEFSADPTWLDFLIEDATGAEWTFRRDEGVTRSLDAYAGVSADGVPYVRPEVQLLHKAKPHPEHAHRNDGDFARVLPRLGAEARAWLRAALGRLEAGHAWLDRL